MAAASAAAAARRTARWISYCRVSTDQQGIRGLGIEAQRAAIAGYVDRSGGELVEEYVEVESGKRADRPQLRESLSACQRLGARLIIAKLDRLSRSMSFIANLMESRADFVIVDMPDANRLTIHIMAAVAENEREMISKRTKDALQAAKARGVKLGNPHGIPKNAAARGRKLGQELRSERARRFAERMSGQVNRLRNEGLSLRAIARVLNEEGTLTATGKAGSWTATAVRNLIAKAQG
jgi:DNA invertase Pin-like site-specific DNA recombinase